MGCAVRNGASVKSGELLVLLLLLSRSRRAAAPGPTLSPEDFDPPLPPLEVVPLPPNPLGRR